jgi:5-methylcytosine-specific restriction protein A
MPIMPSSKIHRPNVHTAHRHREPRYNTSAWRAIRQSVLRDEPLCRECRSNDNITTAQMVDHINPVRLGGSFTDRDNLQPLCNSCHAVKSGKESRL